MRYIMMIGDGMADEPIPELGGKTPLEYANTPNMDSIAKKGICGLVSTIPEGFSPGSDVANMSLMGYSPVEYYSGRAPIEAASMGIDLKEDDVAFRCNLVNIDNGLMNDYSAGHIETSDAAKIIDILAKEFNSEKLTFYHGVSYRHIAVFHGIDFEGLSCTPPHDITGKKITDYLPVGKNSVFLHELMKKAHNILKELEINKQRIENDKVAVSDIWLWGQGKGKKFPSLEERYNISGVVISAVDLVKGLGKLGGMKVVTVEGATGYLDTNFKGKVEATKDALKDYDFVYLHVEAPDETSHEGILEKKLQAIELFDAEIVGPVLEFTKGMEDVRVIVLPDHPTLLRTKTHDSSPVPFAMCGKNIKKGNYDSYSEKSGAKGNRFSGIELFDKFIRGKF